MPYVFVLPALALYLAGMGLALLIATFYQPVSWLRPILTSVLIWSLVGFVASMALFFLLAFVMVEGVATLHSGEPSTVLGVAMALFLLLGPFVATGLGLGGGALFAIWRQFKRGNRLATTERRTMWL